MFTISHYLEHELQNHSRQQNYSSTCDNIAFFSDLIDNFDYLLLGINNMKSRDYDLINIYFHKTALSMSFLTRNISSFAIDCIMQTVTQLK